ncbi:MAG: hypothetical protein ABSF52_22835 [Syntrophobacteraceae bacterium]|jgi:hypothetical protein
MRRITFEEAKSRVQDLEGIPRTPKADDRHVRGCLPGYASLVA